jgi:hypothetical protein
MFPVKPFSTIAAKSSATLLSTDTRSPTADTFTHLRMPAG